MKICIVCARLSYGGAERVAVAWANGFFQKGHEVMVISNLYDPVTYQLDKGIKIRNLVANNRNKLKKWVGSFSKARKLFKEFHPDVVISVMATCSFVSRVASLGLGIPVVATEHYSFDMEPFKEMSAIEYFCKFYINRIYSHVTVLTEEDKHVIGNRLKHVSVMPNPLALQPINVSGEELGRGECVFLAAGRLDAWYYKGFDVLIKAWGLLIHNLQFTIDNSPDLQTFEGTAKSSAQFSRLADVRRSGDAEQTIDNGQLTASHFNWRLQIAGTGSEESLSFLKQLCKENGVVDSVDFLGFVSDMEVLYKKASVFVLSSRYEGFGLVLIEAMSQGRACIACDHKGRQREIIVPREKSEHRSKFNVQSSNSKFEACENGILCEPDNAKALAEAMAKMIEDEEYRESVRMNAVERSNYYSIENTMDRWESLLSSLQCMRR